MILDRLSRRGLYRGLHRRLDAALEWLATIDATALATGRHDLEGTGPASDGLFALVQDYTTRPVEELRYEAHRRYWDVQYVASGVERIGWGPRPESDDDRGGPLELAEPHSVERDVAFFRGAGQLLLVPAGHFAIFAPTDVHLPCAIADSPCAVRKIVIKAELT